MIQDHIKRVEKHIKELDPRIRKDLDLPDGWSVNESNEVRARSPATESAALC